MVSCLLKDFKVSNARAHLRKRGRFNWSGSGSEIGNAIALAIEYHFVPVGFVDLKARDFLRVPFDKSLRNRIVKGVWITHGVDTWA